MSTCLYAVIHFYLLNLKKKKKLKEKLNISQTHSFKGICPSDMGQLKQWKPENLNDHACLNVGIFPH